MILDAYENALKIKPKKDHRFRIEHSTIVDDELIKRIKKIGAIPIPQPEFVYSSGDTYRKLYGDRADMIFPLKSFLDAGIKPAFSTDCPVVDEDPMLVLRSACRRQTTSGNYLGRDQAISLMDAIRMYTYNGAYASFDEDIKGSLEVGKLADFIILSKPILDTSIDDLCSIEVEETVVGGEVVYSK
jgi:predicted amidohydrolase YtcJ